MQPYYKKIRNYIGHDNLILPSVAARIGSPNKILLVRKRDQDIWSVPAGAVEPEENAEYALKREILEELNMEVAITKLLGIYTDPKYDLTYPNGDKVHPFIIFFECEVVGIKDTFRENEEILEMKYFSQDEMPDNMPVCCKDKFNDAFLKSDEIIIK